MRPDLPDDGVYLSWPDAGDHWIHGDDRELASRWIPSSRVLHRVSWDGDYYHLYYGHEKIRVRPSMWLRVPTEPLFVGDLVEVLSHFHSKEALIARVVEKLYSASEHRIEYWLRHREQKLPTPFVLSDLQSLTRRPSIREGYVPHPPPKLAETVSIDYLPWE